MLPSKKIWIALVILIIGLIAIGWYRFGRNFHVVYSNTNKGSLFAVTSPLSTSSPDYATSQNTDDTFIVNNTDTTNSEKPTATDIFSRDLLAKILKLKQAGITVDSSNSNQIVGDYLKTAPLPTINQNTYSLKDIISTDSSRISLQKYQTDITSVFAKYWPTSNENETLIIQNALTNDSPTALNGLTEVITAYQNTLNYSLKLSVPQSAIQKHLSVINALSAYIQTLKMIQLEDTDPVSGMTGLKWFLTNRTNLFTSTANLRIFLINSLK